MGSIFGSNDSPQQQVAPPAPPPLPPSAIVPTMANQAVRAAGANQAARAAASLGASGTKTSPMGDLSPAPTAKAQLLGGG